MESNFHSDEYHLEETVTDQETQSIIMHMDIDYFYAQVELLKQPELRGKPVIVGHGKARETGRGVVITCTYEAREYGVHSGQPMKQALERCPQAIIVSGSTSEYHEFSDEIMEILQNYNLPMRKTGCDEAYLDITSYVNTYTEAQLLGKEIKQLISDKTQLTVSIGIAPTLKLAKFGSDYNKPDGLTIISPDKIPSIFNEIPNIKIPGIGKKTAKKLNSLGYNTCDELFKLTKPYFSDVLGAHGLYLYNLLHAESENKILPRGDRKSISNSRTFMGEPGDVAKSREMLNKLFTSSYSTMVDEGYETRTVGLRIRFHGFETLSRAISLPFHTTDEKQLFTLAQQIIEPYLNDPRGIRLIGVGFYNLQRLDTEQLSLSDFESQGKSHTPILFKGKSSLKKIDEYF